MSKTGHSYVGQTSAHGRDYVEFVPSPFGIFPIFRAARFLRSLLCRLDFFMLGNLAKK
jgi:hypothetical protein